MKTLTEKAELELPFDDLVERIVLYASQEQLREMVGNMTAMGDVGQFLSEYGVKLPGYNT